MSSADGRGKAPGSRQNWFLPGNQAARQHGGYARHFPPELAEIASESDPGDSVGRLEELIRLERLKLHSVLAAKARWDAGAEYNELGASDMELSGIDTNAEGTTVRRRRPDFEQATDRAVGRISHLIEQKERIAASPAAVAPRLAAVLDEAAAAGLDATSTAEACERAGLAVPFSLQQRTRAELATLEPEEPEGGMTDDELEALSAEYAEASAGEPDWLSERRQQVQQIHHQRDKERTGQ